VHTDDVLISRRQVLHGAIGIVKPEHHGMKVSNSYIVLRPRAGVSVSPRFFSWMTHLPEMYRAAVRASHGVHIEKMMLDRKAYLRTLVRLPVRLAEQLAIAELLEMMQTEERLLAALHSRLLAQRHGLVDRLVSGDLRVLGAE
jgi:type I restriction enzyme S subunit